MSASRKTAIRATYTTPREIDLKLIEEINLATNAQRSISNLANISTTNEYAKRIVELAIIKLRELNVSAYRSSIKPVQLPSYRKDQLEALVNSAHQDNQKKAVSSTKGLSGFSQIAKSSGSVVARAKLALTILDSWMIGDKPLRNATRLDVQAELEHDKSARDGLNQNVLFYTSIVNALPNDKAVVGDHLGVKEINEFREQAYVG